MTAAVLLQQVLGLSPERLRLLALHMASTEGEALARALARYDAPDGPAPAAAPRAPVDGNGAGPIELATRASLADGPVPPAPTSPDMFMPAPAAVQDFEVAR